jgi:hypothetical protein
MPAGFALLLRSIDDEGGLDLAGIRDGKFDSVLYEFVCRDPSYPCCRRIRLALSIEVGYLPGLLSNSNTMPSPTHPLALGRSGGRRGRARESSQPQATGHRRQRASVGGDDDLVYPCSLLTTNAPDLDLLRILVSPTLATLLYWCSW